MTIATRKQYLRNLFSGYVVLALEVIVAFFLTPFIIAKLGAATYGVWSLLLSLMGYVGLIDVGLRGSVGRYINHYWARRDQAALNEVVGTAVVVLTVLAAGAGVVATALGQVFLTVFPKTPPELASDIAIVLPLMAFSLWLSFNNAILGNLLGAREALYLTDGFSVVFTLLRTAGIVWALREGYGLLALITVGLVLQVVSVLMSLWAVNKVFGTERPTYWGFSGSRLAEIWRYGMASFVSRSASTMANDSAPIIGMWLLGPQAVGIYSVALTLTQNARRLTDLADRAIFPSVMRTGGVGDLAGLRTLYIKYMDVFFAIGSLVFVGLIFFSEPFLVLWVGSSYQPAALVVGVVAFGYLMQGVSSTTSLALGSLDRINTTMKIGIAEAVGCVVLTAALPGLFGLGLLGLALGTTLPRLVTNVVVYPWLATQTFGAELLPARRQALKRNLLLCAGLSLLYGAIAHWVPMHNWPGMLAVMGSVTVLQLVLVATRLEAIPALAKTSARLRQWLGIQPAAR